MHSAHLLYLLLLSSGLRLVACEPSSASSIYIFNYHSTVDNRTNLTDGGNNHPHNHLKLNFGNLSTQSADNDERTRQAAASSFQPVYTPAEPAMLNLSATPSIQRMEAESFKPDFVDELPKEERAPQRQPAITKQPADLPTSESATILINSMNNSRMYGRQTTGQPARTQSTAETNRTDGDIVKFEDELDVQPHASVASDSLLPSVNGSSSPSTTSTPKPEEEETLGKRLKKKHLQMLQLKKKLKNSPNKFAAIKIRAPRLQFSNSSKLFASDKQARRHKIGYASLVRTRNVNLTDYHADDKHFIKKRIRNLDQLDSSGSENRQIRLIMIHSYKKPAVERFAKRILNNGGQESQTAAASQAHHPIFVKLHGNRRLAPGGGVRGREVSAAEAESIVRGLTSIGQLNKNNDGNNGEQPAASSQPSSQSMQNMFSATYQSSSNRYIPKLLLPRFTRPKMYSLNGYIPKPNMQKLADVRSSTTSSSSLTQFQRNKSGRKPADKQLDKVGGDETKRRRFGSKSSTNDLEDNNDLNASGSATRKRQILFMKRKGFVEEEENSVKPKKSTNRKQLKAIDFQFPKANYPKELLESLNIRPEAPKFEYPNIRRDLIKDAKAGKSYPTYADIPKTNFQCPEELGSGVFADLESRCQSWHMCNKGTKHSFLCANGTVFNEKVGVCDHWYNVDCSPNNLNAVKLTKLY